MNYVLHYAPDNASLIVRLALVQLGLPFHAELVDRKKYQQRSPEYLAMNPNGLIPTLQTPHGAIFETGAILLYLVDRYGGLGPKEDALERGDFLKWMFFVSNTLHCHLRMLFYPQNYVGDDPQANELLSSRTRSALLEDFQKLENLATQGHSWFGAKNFSALDFYVLASLRWSALYPIDQDSSWFDLARHPNLQALCLRFENTKLLQCLMTQEGMNATPFSNPQYPNPPQGSAT